MTLTKPLFLTCFAVLFIWSMETTAQSVAAFSSIKGTVTIQSDGSSKKARKSSKLRNGDRVKTGENGRAVIIYYSGKEVVMRSNDSHTIRSKKNKKNSRTGGIGKVVSDLFWGKEKSKSVAGTTRWQGEKGDSTLQIAYPMRSKITEHRPVFRWYDLQQNGPYKLTIRSEVSDFLYTVEVVGSWFEYPASAPRLHAEEQYVWSVENGSRKSNEVFFSILHDDEAAYLKQDMQELEALAAEEETPVSDITLSVLYYQYNLFHLARLHAENAASIHAEMPQLHMLLETVNLRLGDHKAASINAARFAKTSSEE